MANEANVRVGEQIIRSASLAGLGGSVYLAAGVIVAPNGEVGPNLVSSPSQLLEQYTIDGSIPKGSHPSIINAYRLLQSTSLLLVRSVNSKTVQALANVQNAGSALKVYLKGDQVLKSTINLSVTITDPLIDWSFAIGPYIFYKGTKPVDPNPGTTVFVSVASLQEVYNYLVATSVFEDSDPENTEITGTTLEASFLSTYNTATSVANTVVTKTVTDIDLSGTAFLIVAKNPVATDQYTVSITAGSDDIHILTVNEVDYEFSLVPETTNEFGINVYYEYINDLGKDFYILVLNDSKTIVDLPETTFGASMVDLTKSAESKYLIEALTKIGDQENYVIDAVTDLGTTVVSYQNAMKTIGAKMKSIAAISLPSTILDADQAIAYRNALGDYNNMHISTPADKTTGLLGFETVIAPSTLYIEAIVRNRNNNSEFAPTFGQENGRVSVTKLMKNYSLTEREKMLTYQINTIVTKASTGVTYFNDGLTGQKIKDIVSEDQNRRIVNRINRDLEMLLVQFLGKLNTSATRDSVTNIIKLYMDTQIMTQYYTLKKYRITCNDDNNPASLQAENKLAVLVEVICYNSIKYIEVLNKVYSLANANF